MAGDIGSGCGGRGERHAEHRHGAKGLSHHGTANRRDRSRRTRREYFVDLPVNGARVYLGTMPRRFPLVLIALAAACRPSSSPSVAPAPVAPPAPTTAPASGLTSAPAGWQ